MLLPPGQHASRNFSGVVNILCASVPSGAIPSSAVEAANLEAPIRTRQREWSVPPFRKLLSTAFVVGREIKAPRQPGINRQVQRGHGGSASVLQVLFVEFMPVLIAMRPRRFIKCIRVALLFRACHKLGFALQPCDQRRRRCCLHLDLRSAMKDSSLADTAGVEDGPDHHAEACSPLRAAGAGRAPWTKGYMIRTQRCSLGAFREQNKSPVCAS